MQLLECLPSLLVMTDIKGRKRRLLAPCVPTGDGRAADWSDLPSDPLCVILSFLTVVDYIRFGAVCRSWRSAAQLCQHPPAAEPPWVVLPRLKGGDGPSDVRRRSVLCPRRRMPYRLDLPEDIAADRFVGSSHGWLVLVHGWVEVRLFNPLTGAVIGFPPLTAIPGVGAVRGIDGDAVGLVYRKARGKGGEEGEAPPPPPPVQFLFKYPNMCFVDKAVLMLLEGMPNGRPAVAGGFSVVLMLSHIRELAIASERDDSWALLDAPTDICRDVAYHGGLLYAASSAATVVYDVAPHTTPRIREVLPVPDIQLGPMVSACYLVEVAGDLLQVFRMLDYYYHDDDDDDDDDDEDDGEDQPRPGPLRTTSVRILRIAGGRSRWEAVEGLGEASLFLGVMGSASFSARDFPWLAGNAIYFSDDYQEKGCREEGGVDMGVYHLGDVTMRLYRPRRCNRQWFRGWWFTPRLL